MEGHIKIALISLGALATCVACFFGFPKTVLAEATPHIIINEIQTSGKTSSDEFIELFNPAGTPVVLDGYKIVKKTKTGSESTLLSSATSTKFLGTIPAHGYFLITHPDYKIEYSADLAYASSSSIASDNAVLLFDKDGTFLDKVGFGSAADFESAPAPNPPSNQSLERNSFIDTDNNANDFFINSSPSPQNSSVVEINEEEPQSGDNGNQNTAEECSVSSTDIRLNEIFPYPESGDEFVEIRNTGESCVDVSGWKMVDKAGHKIFFPEDSIVEAKGYLSLKGNLYLNNDSDIIYLLDADGNIQADALETVSYEKALKNFSYSFHEGNWQWTSMPTPEDDNMIEIPEDESGDNETAENNSYARKVFLSEILPNPKNGSGGEYIEIKNNESEETDLFGWMIRDASKTGKYIFKEHVVIKPGMYLVIYRPQFKIALNDSAESIYLYNPAGTLVSSASYDKAPKGISYNFDGISWKWSKYLTPKKDNKFDSPPAVKIKKIKNAYKNFFTEFSASARDKETKKLKYTWDFGDGRKSYLAKARHKYLATGSYRVALTVRDDSQAVEKSFRLVVKKYPRPDLEILKLLPNPAGKDTEGEIIDVRNNSKKKVDLKSWKIATGSSLGKIYNHPISEELILSPGETKTITREFSKFSLNNKTGKVQLVFPDGKIADELEYSKEKIADDETYIKLNDEWTWLAPDNPDNNSPVAANEDDDATDEEELTEEGEVLGATDKANVFTKHTGFTSEDAYIFLSRINFLRQPEELNYSPMLDPSLNIAYLIASLI